MRWPWQKAEQKVAQFETVLQRLIASQEGRLGVSVTPDTCMQSPTVNAIVTAVSRRLASTPIHVYRKSEVNGRAVKQRLPDHSVAKLLMRPNAWQTPHDFWGDATSTLVRWGRFYAFKDQGAGGPIRGLVPIHPAEVTPRQDPNTYQVTFHVGTIKEKAKEYSPRKFFHCRGPSRDFYTGDSPVDDVSNAIALEILAEKHGVAFFRNGGMPGVILSFMEGSAGFESAEQEEEFVKSFKAAFGGDNKFANMLLPPGLDKPFMMNVEHDKAQFLETRKYQRTVIAGAFGVPPHLVGDLERATFNNVEQQDQDFTSNVVMPFARAFEQSMERDLLTDYDQNNGVIIRFNLDSILRADFKSRQEGLQIQRQNGAISANEWREIEGMNPRENGDEYWDQGPSGQTAGNNNEAESDDTA